MKASFGNVRIAFLFLLPLLALFAAGNARCDDEKVKVVFANSTQRCVVLKQFGSEVASLKLPPGAEVVTMLSGNEYKRDATVRFSVVLYKRQACEGEFPTQCFGNMEFGGTAVCLDGRDRDDPALFTYKDSGVWRVEILKKGNLCC
jgi:hypothetical protein